MSVDITIRVPDELGRQLEQYRDRLPELLERGLRDVQVASAAHESTASEIIAVLASQPTPDQVLALRPTEAVQDRVTELLQRSKQDGLSRAEEAELERHLHLEHLVRLAEARALEQSSSVGANTANSRVLSDACRSRLSKSDAEPTSTQRRRRSGEMPRFDV